MSDKYEGILMIASQSKVIHSAEQRGIAAILLLLLVGMTLTVMVLGTSAYLRQQQVYTLSNHAQTQAQLKAWTGAELVRQYLSQVLTEGEWNTLMNAGSGSSSTESGMSKSFPLKLDFNGEGITGQVESSIISINSVENTVTAHVTGIAAQGSLAESRATLELVYALDGIVAQKVCENKPNAVVTLRGNTTISASGSQFVGNGAMQTVAVDGNLTITQGGNTEISACATGNIEMNGGKIANGSQLTSQNGSIRITGGMTPMVNASLWANDIDISRQDGHSFVDIKSGAFEVKVLSNSTVIGSARVGGTRLGNSMIAPLFFDSKFFLKNKDNQDIKIEGAKLFATKVVIDSSDKTTSWLLDLSAETISINKSTGEISGIKGAYENLSGIDVLPERISFLFDKIYGGSVKYTNPITTQNILWGSSAESKSNNIGNFGTFLIKGDFVEGGRSNIKRYYGESDFWVTGGDCNNSRECWGFPVVDVGSVSGIVWYGSQNNKKNANTIAGYKYNGVNDIKIDKDINVPLPGVPFCDTRTASLDVDGYREQANYIFDFDASNRPILIIQNVGKKDGQKIERRVIDLWKDGARYLDGKELFTCNADCVPQGNQWYTPSTPTRASGWNFSGLQKSPAGIIIFNGRFQIDWLSANVSYYNSWLSTTDMSLSNSAQAKLIAPNFANSAKSVCDGDFYPTNICAWNEKKKEWEFTNPLFPLANVAVAVNNDLLLSSWTHISGSVLVGKKITTAGAAATIYGTLNAGINIKSASSNTINLNQPLRVDTSSVKNEQINLPGAQCSATPSTSSSKVNMKWSRFL